jgi:pre-rRNA-processing protein TSR1
MANEQNLTAEDEAEIMSQGTLSAPCMRRGRTCLTTTHFINPVSGTEKRRRKKKVPKGYSAYQSAWIIDSDEDEDEDDGEADENEEDEGSMEMEGNDEKGKEHNDMGMEGSEHSEDGEGEEPEDDEDDGEDDWTEDGDGTETIDMEAAELYAFTFPRRLNRSSAHSSLS